MSQETEIAERMFADFNRGGFVTSRGRIRGEPQWMSMPLAALMSDFEDGRARYVRWFRSWDDAKAAAGLQQ